VKLHVVLASALVIATPAPAVAARPAVTTGGAARVTQTSATLTGSVDPNGRATTYVFRYGLRSDALASQTPPVAAGGGARRVGAAADIGGLAPGTRYFYRLVASNRDGTSRGDIRSFRTQQEPTTLTLAAAPNPVRFGDLSVLSGRLSGPGNASQAVSFESRTFPFIADFARASVQVLTDANGNFAFPALPIPVTTQVRAIGPRGTRSGVLTVGVAFRVSTSVNRTRLRRGQRVRFAGTIRPARPGVQVGIQRRRSDGTWGTIDGTITRGATSAFSRYGKTIRPSRSGLYRMFVLSADGNYVSSVGREIRLRVLRRR
jgi:hypothetical protein